MENQNQLEKKFLNAKYIYLVYDEENETTDVTAHLTFQALFEDYLRIANIFVFYKDLIVYHEKLEKNGVLPLQKKPEERMDFLTMAKNSIDLVKFLYAYELKKENLI